MPFYKLSLRMAMAMPLGNAYKWSNTFNVLADSATQAAQLGQEMWVDALRSGCRSVVYCYEVYATDRVLGGEGGTPNTQDFHTRPVDPGLQRGGIPYNPVGQTASDLYWRDVCLNVELSVPNSRPDRKYWRPGLQERDFNTAGQFVALGLTTAVEGAFTDLLGAFNPLDGDGNGFTGVRISKAGVRRLGRQAFYNVPPAPPEG